MNYFSFKTKLCYKESSFGVVWAASSRILTILCSKLISFDCFLGNEERYLKQMLFHTVLTVSSCSFMILATSCRHRNSRSFQSGIPCCYHIDNF
jgi:hypothetical protein